MSKEAQSQYIRYNNESALIRKWVACMLLKSDLDTNLIFGGLDRAILSLFDTSGLDKDNHEDPVFMRAWIADQRKACEDARIDEADVFSRNTAQIRQAAGLSATELAILRCGFLINSFKPLDAASDALGSSVTEIELCEMLSEMLDESFEAVFNALHPRALLRRSGLVNAGGCWSSHRRIGQWLETPSVLAQQIFREQNADNILLDVFYQSGPRSTLTLRDFSHLRDEISLLKDYLKASYKSKAVGANILLWGPPGTGKTELARYLAQSLRKRSLEVNSIDSDGGVMSAVHRFDCYRFCQVVVGRAKHSLVTFDEVEEILCNDTFARLGFKGESRFSKGLINNVLENNACPSIWITNTVGGVDPAYLRRFDIAAHLKTPVSTVKKRIAKRVFGDLPLDRDLVQRIVENHAVTPAHLQKVTKICRRLGVETASEAKTVVNQVLNGDLKALSARPLKSSDKARNKVAKLKYRSSLVNCDEDVRRLTESLDADGSARLCLFGPPGTGKTAWASHLAKSIRKPLLVKNASDVLDKYIGGTEKNIAKIFREAKDKGCILMLDEVDSFLPDRSLATRHWEITQANQFLTAMENYEGILICTTNLKGNLDPATMRRFDFKINFDYLKPEQAFLMAFDLLTALNVRLSKAEKAELKEGLSTLTLSHGDFAAMVRRYAALKKKPNGKQVLDDLRSEASYRDIGTSRPIGFIAEL